MKFIRETFEEFNLHSGANLSKGMAFSEIVKNIEDSNNDYFYISMCKNDIIEAVNDEKEIIELIKFSPIYIKELGVYILLHN